MIGCAFDVDVLTFYFFDVLKVFLKIHIEPFDHK